MFAAPRHASAVVACLFIAVAACSKPPAPENTGRPDSAAAPKVTDSATASANLRGTNWRLVSVGDKPVTAPADTQRVAHMILQTDSKSVVGSGGCNRMFGVYELSGEKLRFSGVGSTKMACPTGMDTESAFLQALLKVARWRVLAKALELSDSGGVVLAKFEAR
jgi:heat shock protein HslJ